LIVLNQIIGLWPVDAKSVTGKTFCYQVISDPLLWRLPCPRRGKSPLTYPDTSSRDTGLILGELAQAMADRAL